MAYRRKQGTTRATTFEDFRSFPPAAATTEDESESASSLAAQAIRASAAHRDSSLSSAYGESAYRQRTSPPSRDAVAYEYTSLKSLNESKYGFWGVLARKAKAILDDDNEAQQSDRSRIQPQMLGTSTDGQYHQPYRSPENHRKTENPTFQKGSEAISSSLNYIGGTIKNALEEGLKNVENRTADIIQETRKLQIRRKGSGSSAQNQATDPLQIQTDHETQLKASRDVANAMAAKAKLLLRELKTIKADLAFAKERCRQLEEENKILRESREKGDNAEDDDLIRLQLETLLAEKARLAHENSIYARENRFLREIVEYHQLTMQDVVYVDEGIEEVTEVYPFPLPSPSPSPHSAPVLSPAAASIPPSSSPSPGHTSPPSPVNSMNSMVVLEPCSIVPTPPTPPPQIATVTLCPQTQSTPSPPPIEGLNHHESSTQSA